LFTGLNFARFAAGGIVRRFAEGGLNLGTTSGPASPFSSAAIKERSGTSTFSQPPGISVQRFGPRPFAEGGAIHGPGSGTSDSIPALLSAGEYVHRSSAVNHYGVSMMHAINNMTFPKFSLGGLVDHISSAMTIDVPRFASGGLAAASGAATAAASHVVNLHFPDRSFNNLRTTAQTAEELRNYAIGRQTASTGPRPSWVGG
jgi:hypothetical protein